MKLFHLIGFTKELVLICQLLLPDLTCFRVFKMALAFLRNPAGTACYAFEAFSRGCILLE